MVSRGVTSSCEPSRGARREGLDVLAPWAYASRSCRWRPAFSILNLEKAATSLLAGAGIVGLALGFAFQDLAANFIAGVYLAVRFPFREGDLIETNDTLGIAERIRIRSTTIRTLEGQAVMIPNKEIFTTKLINDSETGARRVDLSVGVSYGDDLDKVRRVALDAARQVRARDTDPVPGPHARLRRQGRCAPDRDGATGADRRGRERQRHAGLGRLITGTPRRPGRPRGSSGRARR
ncbi:mechanosensitive ion channel family protein [Sorangium sp. So ce1128]